jgi:hypothetical protein
MNAAFEDCAVLDECLDQFADNRERAFASDPPIRDIKYEMRFERRRRRRRAIKAFLFGLIVGMVSLVAAALIFGSQP